METRCKFTRPCNNLLYLIYIFVQDTIQKNIKITLTCWKRDVFLRDSPRIESSVVCLNPGKESAFSEQPALAFSECLGRLIHNLVDNNTTFYQIDLSRVHERSRTLISFAKISSYVQVQLYTSVHISCCRGLIRLLSRKRRKKEFTSQCYLKVNFTKKFRLYLGFMGRQDSFFNFQKISKMIVRASKVLIRLE